MHRNETTQSGETTWAKRDTVRLQDGSECWAIKNSQEHRIQIAESRMFQYMTRVTQKDRIRNGCIRRGILAVVDIWRREEHPRPVQGGAGGSARPKLT